MAGETRGARLAGQVPATGSRPPVPHSKSRMTANQTNGFWRSAAQCLLGTIALALLTLVGFRLQVNFATASLLCLILVVLLSATGGFIPSVFVSVIGAVCLEYFFATPIFSLRVDDPRTSQL